ncbi:MAG: hypothetical protein VX294_02045 [Candidatus Latescibacterota bacterium]|nr:hypothetical protein [Candidatus Latescibacterota bacterium]
MMRKIILSAVLLTGLAAQAFAEVNVSADVVSRYLWRGAQQPGGMAVQPSINYSTGSVEIGTWVSQSMMGDASETDLYVSLDAGPVGLTITDYTDSFNDLFSVGDHLIEVMATYESGDLSAAVAVDVLNGNSDLWVELGYAMGQMGDADVSLSLGLGNEKYTSDGDPMLALIGINASQGAYFASYQINPDVKGNMVMIGKTF